MLFPTYDSGVAVIIPTYNNAHFLERCLASIQSQTQPVDEIVVIDDGSTDNTDALLKNLQNVIPNLTCVRQVNQGDSAARNTGLALTRHGIVAFLDADDTWTPVHIEECCNAFRLFPDAAIAFAKYELRDEYNNSCENERTIYSRRDLVKKISETLITDKNNKYFSINHDVMLQNIIMERLAYHTSGLVINRHRLPGNFFFDASLRFGADLDYVNELLFAGAKPVYIDNLHTFYYIHATNTVCIASDTLPMACEKMKKSTAHKEKTLMYCRTYNEYNYVLKALSRQYLIIAYLLFDMARYGEGHKYFQISFRLVRRLSVLKHILAYSLLGDKGMPYLVRVLKWSKRLLSKAKRSSLHFINSVRASN
jgi:glycosyltransferase involved in cell wall biosynthesis